MIIFPSLAIIFMFIISQFKLNKSWLVISLSIILILIIFHPILNGLYDLLMSEKFGAEQGGTLTIRLQAVDFFLNQLFPSFGSYIIGNGFASYHDQYGNYILFLIEKFKFYQADIGIIGDYTRFGLIFIFGIILLLIKIFKFQIVEEVKYIKYFFVYVGITCITIPHFGYSDGIVAICCGLYLIEKNSNHFSKTFSAH